MYGEKNIALVPSKASGTSIGIGDSTNLLNLGKFELEMTNSSLVFVLVGKSIDTKTTIPKKIRILIEKFQDIFSGAR